MVDILRLRALLDRLRSTEAELGRLRELGVVPVRADADRVNSLKYLFVLAAEVAIDTGQHVIASEGFAAPGTFADVFHQLGRAGWLDDDLAESMAGLARFRNLLVHGYADVDDDRVLQILHSDASADIARFRQAVTSRALDEK
jgi:uncharacterized protein YutE (UPF0331/DUF86 family)